MCRTGIEPDSSSGLILALCRELDIVLFTTDRTERDVDRRCPVVIPEHEILEPLRFEFRAVAAQERLALVAPVGFHFSVFRTFIHNSKSITSCGRSTAISRHVEFSLQRAASALDRSAKEMVRGGILVHAEPR